ncbi:MAG: hypothetical protein FVQ78_07430 [Solirubrobacterales bacterium]|nr:hypothetical protein [Solirubrobacterales bacterium]
MRTKRVWGRLLGLERAVVEEVEVGDQGQVVVTVRPRHRERDRCGICRRRSPGFDLGEGRFRHTPLWIMEFSWGATVEQDQPKQVLYAFRFPFVSFPHRKGLFFWGRTPNSRRGKVVIQVKDFYQPPFGRPVG